MSGGSRSIYGHSLPAIPPTSSVVSQNLVASRFERPSPSRRAWISPHGTRGRPFNFAALPLFALEIKRLDVGVRLAVESKPDTFGPSLTPLDSHKQPYRQKSSQKNRHCRNGGAETQPDPGGDISKA